MRGVVQRPARWLHDMHIGSSTGAGKDLFHGLAERLHIAVLVDPPDRSLRGRPVTQEVGARSHGGRECGRERSLAGMRRTDEEMNACLADREFAEAMVEDFQTHATADGIDSTPSFVIDGTKYGNLSYADFESRLNTALGE